MSWGCGVGHRRGLDPMLLWLWYRLEAVAPIRPLALETPYATGTALKSKKKKKIIPTESQSVLAGAGCRSEDLR